ncbi:sulfotransferase 1C4-like [Anticarsia gemmatalis]|uniref:sulfotransferase 1C4-like n=1 Tax=Anticarsia gemmatalis TaxID=129554 RepID=UPI003F76D3E1
MAEQKHFPFEMKELEDEEKAAFFKAYRTSTVDHRFDFVSVGPKKYKQLRRYCEEAANIYNMPVRNSDVFVVTYQRAGTTWTQELVWLLANDLDYATAKAKVLTERFPYTELFTFFDKKWEEDFLKNSEDKQMALKLIENIATPITGKLALMPSPRFVKTHLPLSLLPPSLLDTSKVVYVARDPRDVAVSSYHLARLFKIMDFPGTFKDYWNLFVKDLVNLSPFFPHIKEAWDVRHHPNMLFLFYEELIKDLPAAVLRVADFLGKELTEEQLARLCDHLSFENFRKNESVNYQSLREFGLLTPDENFIRKGKAGGWRDYFDEEMTQQAEQWIADNLRDTDLRFPHMDN